MAADERLERAARALCAARLELPPEGAPYDRASVAGAVGACIAGFEVIDSRYVDRKAMGVATHAADDFSGAGAVLGDAREEFDPLGLDRVRTRLLVNGEEVGTGTGDLVLGHPLEALAWLANALARRGRGLRAGEIVSLGSIVMARMMEAGDEAVAVHEPLGEVRV